MKQQKTRNISWMLILIMAISIISPGAARTSYAAKKTSPFEINVDDGAVLYKKQLNGVTEYLKKSVEKPAVGNEWVVMTLARAGKVDADWYRAYYDSVYNTVKNGDTSSLSKITDNARAVIALSSIGADPQKVAGKTLLEPLYDYKTISEQYVTCAISVLLAFDTSDEYPFPKCLDGFSKGKLVDLILSNFNKETGYIGYEWEGVAYADLDSTAMALQALAPYYKTNANVKPVVDKALEYLSKCQNADGTYGGEYDDKVCSTAQVLLALCCYDIDTVKDERFIKNGKSVLDALLSYAKEDGSIVMDGAYNPAMDCEQAAYALVAYDRMKKAENHLYDMRDAKLMFAKEPAKPTIKKVTSAVKKQLAVKWKKKSGINGYELQVSNSVIFKKTKTNTYKVSKKDTEKLVKKSLKSKKTYYARMRTYKNVKVNDVNYTAYSEWTPVKKIKVK